MTPTSDSAMSPGCRPTLRHDTAVLAETAAVNRLGAVLARCLLGEPG